MTEVMHKGRFETIYHLATKGMVFDGDLISKRDRDILVNDGYVARYQGWNFLTMDGVKIAHDMGLVNP